MNGITSCAIGTLGRGPELKYTQGGQAMLSFSIAVNDAKRETNGMTEWLRVTVWGDQAEALNAAGSLGKGAEAYVEGRIKMNEWTGTDGEKRSGLNLSAWRVDVLGAIGRRATKAAPPFANDVDSPTRPTRSEPIAIAN